LAAGLGDEHLAALTGNVRCELLSAVTGLHPKDTHGPARAAGRSFGWPACRAKAQAARGWRAAKEHDMADPLADLSNKGVSVRLDDLSRQRLVSGSLADLAANDHVVGVTTNPAIFAKAATGSDAYADQMRDLSVRGVDTGEALRALTTFRRALGLQRAAAGLRRHRRAGRAVSIEVDPRLAHDTQTTIAEARALWWLVDRPNLFIKIPAARQGLPAIAACLAEGISINITLIFSLARYDAVQSAFLDGLERARRVGRDLSSIASIASFFVSRVDTEVDARLDKIGTPRRPRCAGGPRSPTRG